MLGLWADGWFYISSAGLLVSASLFVFLLGQYRVASEAADATEDSLGAEKEVVSAAAIRPIYVPDEAPTARVASHADTPKTVGGDAGPERRKDPANTTGGISPAVGYLQNIKVELADLHKDLRALALRVNDELSARSARDEALIDRLGELIRVVENRTAAPAPTPAPAPVPVASTRPEPAHVVLMPAPAPTSSSEPVPEPKTEPEPETSVAQPASALPEAPPEEKPRRGPVWPV